MKSKLLLHKEIEDNIYENLSLNVLYKPSGNLPKKKIKIRNFSDNIYIELDGSNDKKQIPMNVRNFRSKWIAKKIFLIIFNSTETGMVEVTPPHCVITKEKLLMTSSVSQPCDTAPLFFFYATSKIKDIAYFYMINIIGNISFDFFKRNVLNFFKKQLTKR